jgi:ATP-dependent DNA helicase DinG
MSSIAELFASDGALAQSLDGFRHRDAQAAMAELVWDAIHGGRHLAVEAGTGIGKTFAYLLPVLLAGKRAVISTGTKTLQDQLYHRDLPALGAAVGRPLTVALLKGRGNYLCWYRSEIASQGDFSLPHALGGIAALERWARESVSGDLTEYFDLADAGGLHPWVSSTADNCLGTRCQRFDDCFVVKARRQAQAADIVIVNHHLLLADLGLKDAGFGDLLPGVDAVIVDEAHQLPDIAQQFFGVALSGRELKALAADTSIEARRAGLAAELEPAVAALDRAAAAAHALAGGASGRLPWALAGAELRSAVAAWREPLTALAASLEVLRDAAPGLERARERCLAAVDRIETLVGDDDSGLRWFDTTPHNVSVHWTPLDGGRELGERIDAHGGTWIFASATLAVGEDFEHFLTGIGLRHTQTAVLPSPFDYEAHARLYIPQGLPEPADGDFIASYLRRVWPLVIASGGGAFLLFTSHRALERARAWLDGRPTPGPLWVQGEASRTELLERFRAAGDGVLLGTGSFWQGVDVKGPALRVVAIDKLPFAAPTDPLTAVRLAAIRAQGEDPFTTYQLPQAVLSLKQGVGRLIRDFDDRGLVIIGDPRLRTRPYGRAFLASLPPMPLLETEADALDFAASLQPVAVAAAETPA